MALPAPTVRKPGKFVLVSKYEVHRIGKYPHAAVTFAECDYLFSAALTILAGDAETHQLTIADISALPEADVVGHLLSTADSDPLGTVVAVTHDAEQGVSVLEVTPPETPYAVDQVVQLVDKMPVGTTAYTPTPGGAEWTIWLDGRNPDAMAALANMVGTILFDAGKLLLEELAIPAVTDAQLFGAVAALAARGHNVDGLYAKQGELLEEARQAMTLPYATVVGRTI